MVSLGHELGGLARAEAMVRRQGMSLILKSIKVHFRRPVTYLDTVRVHPLRVTCLLFDQKDTERLSTQPPLLASLRMMTLRLSMWLPRLIPLVNVPLLHIRMNHWSGTILTSGRNVIQVKVKV